MTTRSHSRLLSTTALALLISPLEGGADDISTQDGAASAAPAPSGVALRPSTSGTDIPVAAPGTPAPESSASTPLRWALRLNALSSSGIGGLEGAAHLGPWELAATVGWRSGLAVGWRHDSGFTTRAGLYLNNLWDNGFGWSYELVPTATVGWEWRVDHVSMALGIGGAMVPAFNEDVCCFPTPFPYADARVGWIF